VKPPGPAHKYVALGKELVVSMRFPPTHIGLLEPAVADDGEILTTTIVCDVTLGHPGIEATTV
jgi:hypothetical protein